jgi:hypothetical protein
MGVCAVENSMLFILNIIISLTQITGRERRTKLLRSAHWVHGFEAFF